MKRRADSGLMLTVILISLLALGFPIGRVHAQGTKKVVIDVSRLHSYSPRFELAKGALEGEGYTVDVWWSGNITDDRLAEYCVLIITCPDAPYTPSEVTAILDFVETGHGLLFLGEYGPTWHQLSDGYYPSGADTILGPMGVSINNDLLRDPTDYDGDSGHPKIHTFAEHPVTGNISIYLAAGTATLEVQSPATCIATGDNDTYAETPGSTCCDQYGVLPLGESYDSPPKAGSYEPVLAVSTYGEGRAVVAGDHNWITDQYGGYYDNIQLLVNTVRWLSPRVHVQTRVFFNVHPNPASVGETITLQGILVGELSQPPSNETVKLYARPIAGSWRYITSLTTGSCGIFTWQVTIPEVPKGAYVFAVYYPGSEAYASSYNFAILIIQ